MSSIYRQAIAMRLEESFSPERFQRYLNWADDDKERAFYLYALNTQLSEALYTPLQILEVVLRNRFHGVLSDAYGELWFEREGLLKSHNQTNRLARAKQTLAAESKVTTAGAIVSSLTFGFWTGLLSPDYENLWQKTLHKSARDVRGKGLTRKQLIAPLNPIRILRNRIAHHEPILFWNLPRHHLLMLQITQWLSPAAYEWSQHHSRFDSLYPQHGIALQY